MSRNVNIEFFRIAQTRVNPEAVLAWLKHLDVSDDYTSELEQTMMEPEEGEITDAALLVALAAKRCYMSFEVSLNPNLSRIRKDWVEYLDNVLKSRHGSVTEHATYTYAIEGVSRVFTGEMNRHRAGVGISEGSMRFIRYRDIPWWLPTFIALTKDERYLTLKGDALKLADKKVRTQQVFQRHFEQTEVNYAELQEIWKEELDPKSAFKGKKEITSMLRRIIPMGVATGGVWTLNIRALRHVLAMRASPGAEEEILHVWTRIGKEIVESEPALFGDFKMLEEGYWVPQYQKI